MIKKIVLILIIAVLSWLTTDNVLASEGTVELRSTTGEDYRCWASSILMQNGGYRMSLSCRDLVYPVEEEIKNYVLWGTPREGEGTIKFGRLQFGKEAFSTKRPFTNLFITTESNPAKLKEPQGRIVMQGAVRPITFLDIPTTATPTPQAEEDTGDTNDDSQIIDEQSEEATEDLTTREKLVMGLKRAGIVAFFALIALVGLVFVVTRSKG